MIDSKTVLAKTMRAAQMGQTGIRCVLKYPVESRLHAALRSQLREYGMMERQANTLAFTRGWELKDLNPAVKTMVNISAHMKLHGKDKGSKTASMVLKGNTMGMIESLKNLRQYSGSDQGVTQLAQHLLETEKENIAQMQGFI